MRNLLIVILAVIGLYAALDWAADNPKSIKKLHQKVDDTVETTVDKGSRAVGELSK
jgi:hypothetical protein